MYSSSELISALLEGRRRRLSLRGRAINDKVGEFPPGWQDWFDSMRERIGAVTGATAAAIVAILAKRELRPAPKAGADLNRWQIFATLWRTSWEPPERESRKDRVAAWFSTAFVHLALLLMWAWFAYVRIPPAPQPAGDDSVVQVEFIGEGTPEETGGSEQAGETPDPRQAVAPAPAAAVPAEPTPQATPVQPSQPQPEPERPAEVATRQPVQVSEPVQPEPRFELPATTPPELEVAPVQRPQVVLVPREREVELVVRPTPPQVQAEIRPQPIDVPPVRPVERQVQQRDVQLVTVPREMPELQSPTEPPVPSVQAPQRSVRGRDVALQPAPASSASTPTPATGQQGAEPAASDTVQGGNPDRQEGQRQAQAPGAGATPSSAPGARPTPTPGDDWGEALRNRPGGNPGASRDGLFGADGRPKLPPGTAQPGGGFPPGSDNWTQDLLDRHGTWSKRTPIGYDPTRFDRYWIPSGTLLQEWVRRGIKSLDIPVPGTSKTIKCTVSLLQLGGGCGISDANLQDQEAIARPPPDIPFKPELQEDNGSH